MTIPGAKLTLFILETMTNSVDTYKMHKEAFSSVSALFTKFKNEQFYTYSIKKVCEYDQKIPQSHTADKSTAP